MKNKIFSVHPELQSYYETSDGQKFFTLEDANKHRKTLSDRKVKQVMNPDYTSTIAPDEIEVVHETVLKVEPLVETPADLVEKTGNKTETSNSENTPVSLPNKEKAVSKTAKEATEAKTVRTNLKKKKEVAVSNTIIDPTASQKSFEIVLLQNEDFEKVTDLKTEK